MHQFSCNVLIFLIVQKLLLPICPPTLSSTTKMGQHIPGLLHSIVSSMAKELLIFSILKICIEPIKMSNSQVIRRVRVSRLGCQLKPSQGLSLVHLHPVPVHQLLPHHVLGVGVAEVGVSAGNLQDIDRV